MINFKKSMESELLSLLKSDLTCVEIADVMGLKDGCVRYHANRLGYPASKRVLKRDHFNRVVKYSDQVKIFKFFQSGNSVDETLKKFNISKSRFKSICTVLYKKEDLKVFRKDNRKKDVWNIDEKIELLRFCGLKDRNWVANRLGRGTHESVKEELSRIGIGSRYVNGLTKSQCNLIFDFEMVPSKYVIKTDAGPRDFKFILIPWVVIEDIILKNRLKIKYEVVKCIKIMSIFQKWIHGTRGVDETVRKIKKYSSFE